MLKLKTPAKINLFLEILNKRPDGYHNLVSIMQTVSLFDELTIESLSNDTIEIESNNKEIPTDSRNLVYKAAQAVKEKFNIKQGVKIYIDKQIPICAGLGGGSSNAAGTIKGLIELWGIMPLDEISKNEQIRLLSSKLGADVPFFLTGGTTLCEGIGDIVAPIKSIGKKNVILINPNFSVSTSEVYNRIKFPLTKISQMYKIPTDFKHWSLDKNDLFNRLEEFVFPYNPEIAKIKFLLIQAGCLALMSGSGSTVFGISKSKDHSDEIIKKLNQYNWKIYNTETH
ncbi:MAG: 4-(cytidine 5'-diphospho)-2-C-methyl-D-erythritol kinase [Elusimicrobiota bacterium]|jgi:4-diphosphocytidyl-2-C-methyl-D-erythritol kinase|nr:4-(cytidine 5'-diphospho)-2-C-methyl-D-erythritol kinase [Elusimicrobiota bacterium]